MNCDGQIGMITIVLEESQIDIFITYCQEDPLEEEMATHYSILAWRTPWTEDPGRLHTVHGVTKIQT